MLFSGVTPTLVVFFLDLPKTKQKQKAIIKMSINTKIIRYPFF